MKRALAALLTTVGLVACAGSGVDTDDRADTTVETTSTTNVDTNVAVTYRLDKIGELSGVVDLVERSPDDDFFYVVGRDGIVERWRRDGSRIDQVLDITELTTDDGERGLLGLAFRSRNERWTAFVNHTDTNGDTVVTSYPVNTDGTFVVTEPAGTVIITIEQPYSNHNGGGLAVGPDGMLYIGMGDGGSANDPGRVSLDMSSLLGKMLRIDPLDGGGYEVPPDNPHTATSTPSIRHEIWSTGLRNPWRFSFDTQGNLWVADVGQGELEEVSVAAASGDTPGGRGVSFGWSAFEGSRRFNSDVDSPGALMPVHEYEHTNGACSISGGAVGTNTATPSRAGWYFYGDFCSGRVTAILTDGERTVAEESVATGLESIVAVRSTSNSMYVLSLSGPVHQVRVIRR